MGHIIQTFTETNQSRLGFFFGGRVLLKKKKKVLVLTIFSSQILHLSRKLPNIKRHPQGIASAF